MRLARARTGSTTAAPGSASASSGPKTLLTCAVIQSPRRVWTASRSSADSASSASRTALGCNNSSPAINLRHGIAEPSNQTVAGQHDGIVDRLGKAGRARGQLLPELRARVWIRVGRVGFRAGGGQNLETANIRPIGDRRRRRDGERVVGLRRFGINHRGPFSTSPRKPRSSSNGPCPSARARFWRRSSLPDRTGSANGALRADRIIGHGARARARVPSEV